VAFLLVTFLWPHKEKSLAIKAKSIDKKENGRFRIPTNNNLIKDSKIGGHSPPYKINTR